MNEHDFDKMDSEFLKKFEKLRDKKVPKRVLDGFSASVEEKIRKKLFTPELEKKRFRMPLWAPVLTVLVLASLVVFRTGLHRATYFERPSNSVVISQPVPVNGDLAVEIAALKEIGEWTEQDETVLGDPADEFIQTADLL